MMRVSAAFGLLQEGDRWFLQRRDPLGAVLPGLWEFPGGKLEAEETPREALLRELQEEVRLSPRSVQALPPFSHVHGDLELRLHPFLCRGGNPHGQGLSWGWFTLSQMLRLPLPAANRAWLEDLPRVLADRRLE